MCHKNVADYHGCFLVCMCLLVSHTNTDEPIEINLGCRLWGARKHLSCGCLDPCTGEGTLGGRYLHIHRLACWRYSQHYLQRGSSNAACGYSTVAACFCFIGIFSVLITREVDSQRTSRETIGHCWSTFLQMSFLASGQVINTVSAKLNKFGGNYTAIAQV